MQEDKLLLNNFLSDELSLEKLVSIFHRIKNKILYEEVSVLIVTGGERVGKSTLIRLIEAIYAYKTLYITSDGYDRLLDTFRFYRFYRSVQIDYGKHLSLKVIKKLHDQANNFFGNHFFIVECDSYDPLDDTFLGRKPMIINLKNKLLTSPDMNATANRCMDEMNALLERKERYL